MILKQKERSLHICQAGTNHNSPKSTLFYEFGFPALVLRAVADRVRYRLLATDIASSERQHRETWASRHKCAYKSNPKSWDIYFQCCHTGTASLAAQASTISSRRILTLVQLVLTLLTTRARRQAGAAEVMLFSKPLVPSSWDSNHKLPCVEVDTYTTMPLRFVIYDCKVLKVTSIQSRISKVPKVASIQTKTSRHACQHWKFWQVCSKLSFPVGNRTVWVNRYALTKYNIKVLKKTKQKDTRQLLMMKPSKSEHGRQLRWERNVILREKEILFTWGKKREEKWSFFCV